MATKNTKKRTTEYFRKKLEEKLLATSRAEKALEADASQATMERTGEISHVRLHAADLGSDTYQQELLSRLTERQIAKIHEIEEALRSVDAGTYGQCEDCGEEIPVARLEILPESKFCTECEGAQETERFPHWRARATQSPRNNTFFSDGV
jgi:RNA polymerase-binding transcription factor DksA